MMVRIYEDDDYLKYKVNCPSIRTAMNESGKIERIEFEDKTYVVGLNVHRIDVYDSDTNEAIKFGWRAQEANNGYYVLTFRKAVQHG